jgi:hypothetical protein
MTKATQVTYGIESDRVRRNLEEEVERSVTRDTSVTEIIGIVQQRLCAAHVLYLI